MSESAELELSLKRSEEDIYALEMRFTQPGSDTDIRVGSDRPVTACFDFTQLRALEASAADYGQGLAEALFADPAFRTAFAQVRASAQTLAASIRLRLLLDASAAELHNLRWETLVDPDDHAPLFTGEQIFFSRYLSSADLRPVRLKPRGNLRALVAAANPANLADNSLAAVDVPGEVGRARAALGSIPITVLPDEAGEQRCTLNRMIEKLREGYDILYLVGHGAFVRNEPWLWLEDDAGQIARVSGRELATRLRELENPPRLVVLASCQSAGNTAGDALLALGPRLAEAGVPAVLAMQGNISMDTVAEFMPVFFKELYKDGQIDRALAVARGVVRHRPDFWLPVLYMRLRSGRLWYTPGFGVGGGFEKWPAVISNLKTGRCTPILGPGLLESLIGSPREIARHWAEQYSYPMEIFEREYLSHVAQYLAVQQSANFPRDELQVYLRKKLLARFGAALPPSLVQSEPDYKTLLAACSNTLVYQSGFDPYRVLAQYPLPLYITTNSDDLLETALREAGKEPQTGICPWNEYIEQSPYLFIEDAGNRPTASRPLVFHFFGYADEPDSLVLTEDDYFNFLIGATSHKDLIPKVVLNAMTNTSMLFLGFDLDGWDFRILYRIIMAQPGGERRKRYPQVGVQVDLESGYIADPERARRYLENYFRESDVSIFWGSADDFLRELSNQWKANP